MNKLVCAVALLVACAGVSVQAQTLKPGLWDLSTTMQSGSGEIEKAMAEAQKELANMPAEQRKMMQDMLGKQGVGASMAGGGGANVRVCMTKEMLARDEIAAQQGDCKSTRSPRVGNTMRITFTCSKPPSSGEGLITFISPEAYDTKMTINTSANGKPERLSMDSHGKWVASECGAIKPISVSKQ